MFRPGERFHRITSRSASLYGSGCRSRALATLKIDVLAPIPMASDSSAAAVKPGFLTNPRTAYRRFRASVFMESRVACMLPTPLAAHNRGDQGVGIGDQASRQVHSSLAP